MTFISRLQTAIVCAAMLLGTIATAQDFQEQLSKFGSDAAAKYAAPFLNGLANDLNSGIYYSADVHNALGFDLGVKYAISKFSNAEKIFSLDMPTRVRLTSFPGSNLTLPAGGYILLQKGTNYQSGPMNANTAVGAKDNVTVKSIASLATVYSADGTPLSTTPLPGGQTICTFPGGYDFGSAEFPGVPLAIPQLALGLPFGLEFMLRYMPTTSAGEYGKFNCMGFGLRYDIDQWIPFCPVDIAVHFITQKLSFKSSSDQEIFNGKATAYGVEVSKRFMVLTLYGGFQLESSSLTVNDYTYKGSDTGTDQTTIRGFELQGNDKSRLTVGARLLLLFINVHADYSFAANPVLTIGAGITLR